MESERAGLKTGTRGSRFSRRWVWALLGILLALLTTWPIVYSFLPVSTAGVTGHPLTCSASSCTIVITNSVFGLPSQTTFYIKVGTAVTWVNHDPTTHTSTSDTGIWDSTIINPGHSFTFTFAKTGTFPYHCNVHPMNGVIVVEP